VRDYRAGACPPAAHQCNYRAPHSSDGARRDTRYRDVRTSVVRTHFIELSSTGTVAVKNVALVQDTKCRIPGIIPRITTFTSPEPPTSVVHISNLCGLLPSARPRTTVHAPASLCLVRITVLCTEYLARILVPLRSSIWTDEGGAELYYWPGQSPKNIPRYNENTVY
jgi:hypothetical protein